MTCPSKNRELLQTLPNQAALALKLTRLADDARLAGIAQQEDQAARLRAESAAAWRRRVGRVLEHLAAGADLDASLGLMLAEVVQQLQAIGGGIWRAEASGFIRLLLSVEDGEVRRAEASLHLGRQSAVAAPRAVFRPKGDNIQIDDEVTFATCPEYVLFREYLALHRIRAIVVVPMYLGDSFLGVVSLRFTEPRALTTEERELLQTCSSQTALLMELTRLSRAARTAAVSEGAYSSRARHSRHPRSRLGDHLVAAPGCRHDGSHGIHHASRLDSDGNRPRESGRGAPLDSSTASRVL